MRIHILRWYRYINELGPIRAILILFILFALMRYAFTQFLAGEHYWGYLPLLLIQAIQFSRKDYKLLQLAHLSQYVLYLLVYSIIGSISVLAFSFLGLYINALIVLGFVVISPLINFNGVTMDRFFLNIGDFLPYKNFEWRTGLRQYGLAVIVLLLCGIGLSKFQGGVPVIIFFLTLNTSVFYLFGESKELLVANYASPHQLIINKLKNHCFIFYLLILPMSILYVAFNPGLWFVLLYVWIVAFLATINAVLFKYRSYRPGARFDNNNVLQGLMLVFFLIPFLFPIPIVMMIINYKKSVENLKPYFYNDH
ncbi:MAG: hypothetical protein JXQ87_00570 [Bacteroidia bacterium]